MLKDRNVDSQEGSRSVAGSSLATSLLVRLKEQDPLAWRRLTALYGPEVYRWGRRAGLRAEDAEDVGQEVFRSVAAKLADFRRENPGDSFRGWLWTITRNKIRDHWRASAGRDEAVGGSAFHDRLGQVPAEPEDSSGSGTSGGLVHRALELVRSDFEERTWQAFWRDAVEGRAAAEVADELGIKPNAVYIAKSRVLSRLRAELGDLIS